MDTRSGILVAILGTLFYAAAAGAQFAPPSFEIGFANPGARSLGFGGAFVALADDATAAFSNPAGLVQLNRVEVSAEARVEIESQGGFSASAVGFLSLVYPRKRFSLALYRTGLADFELGTTSLGPIVGDELFFSRTVASLETLATGLSAAWRVNEGLSVGLGLVSFETRLSGTFEELVVDLRPFSPREELVRASTLDGESTELRLSAGVLWDFAPSWRLGAFYRQGARLDVEFLGTFGPGSETPEREPVRVEATPISFPDTFGLGIVWKTFRDRLTTSFEWDRVGRSAAFERLDRRVFDTDSYMIEDSDDVHLGVEYVFASRPAVALRLGAWREEAPLLSRRDASGRSIPAGDGGVDHVSGGLGIAFRKLQLDVGVDTSRVADLLSLSVIFSFR